MERAGLRHRQHAADDDHHHDDDDDDVNGGGDGAVVWVAGIFATGSSAQPERLTSSRTIRHADRRMLDWICDPGVQ